MNFDTIRQNMAYFADKGLSDVFEQGNSSPASADLSELRSYLIARVMEDPYISEVEYKKHMDEFLEAYYGDGWRYIRAYIDIMHAGIKRHHMKCGGWPILNTDLKTIEDLYDVIESLWNRAEELAGDKIENVRSARLQWTYCALNIKPSVDGNQKFVDELKARNIRWSEGGIDYDSVNKHEMLCYWGQKPANRGRIAPYWPPKKFD